MKKFIGTLIGITILLPFFINLLFGYIIPFLPGTMFVGTNETWVIFIGGFSGASLTLIGVYWQLEKTKEHRNKELISNTDAVYKLLKSELVVIQKKLDNGLYMLDSFQEDISNIKKKMPDMSKKDIDKLENDLVETFKRNPDIMFPVSLQKDIIYSFINNSLPEQKLILIESTNNLLLITEDIKRYNYMNSFDILHSFYNNYSTKSLKKELNELKSNQLNFERIKKKL